MNKKEASFYEKLENKKVRCRLCPWECIILPNNVGHCKVRKNEGGKLYSLIYGVVSSIAMDAIEKKPLFHFYPGTKVLSVGTFGCNMSCGHCQNWQISHVHYEKETLSEQIILPEQLVQVAVEQNAAGIAWTYNEPAIWFEYTLDCAKLAKEKNLYTVYVTNGYINLEPLDEIGPYLDAFRVDIKAFTEESFKKLCKCAWPEKVLAAAEYAKNKWNMHIEIVTNVVPTINDDDKSLKSIADWIRNHLGEETPWHVTRFIPYLEFRNLQPTPLVTLERARQIGLDAGLKYVYIGNIPGNAGENTYCPKCKNLLIERMGYTIVSNHVKDGRCGFCSNPLKTFRQ